MKSAKHESGEGMLAPHRVLDLAAGQVAFCGKILADLGADVIKVEKPGGDPARNDGPFLQDIPHPERSLPWLAYNSNKRGITLDLETEGGQAIFKRLVAESDAVVESFPPGYMDKLGLGYQDLREVNRGIVVTSVTPFGQTGPYKDYEGSDLVCAAFAGHMYLSGDPGGPPVRIGAPQAFVHAAAEAADSILAAIYHRHSSGEGQYIDVPVFACMVCAMQEAPAWYGLNHVVVKRSGAYRVGLTRGSVDKRMRQTWRCKDGWVNMSIYGGSAYSTANRPLVEWMNGEGLANDFLLGLDWNTFDAFTAPQDDLDRIMEPVARFLLAHTKAELLKGASERNIFLCPANSTADIVADPQLQARDFWTEVEDENLGRRLTYPGAFVKASETPVQLKRNAPLVGEHNEEVYHKRMGFSVEEMAALKQMGVI